MAKVSRSRIIMLVVAVVLVLALITATVLVSIEPKAEYQGVLSADQVIKDGTVRYSLKSEGQFKTSITKFLKNLTASFLDTVNGSSPKPDPDDITIADSFTQAIAPSLIEMFATAAIPADKLLNFGSYLAELDSDTAVIDVWLFFIVPIEDADSPGVYKGRFATAQELATKFTTEIDFLYGINSIITNTALTAEEAGRLIYELVYALSMPAQKEVIAAVGRSTLVNLFVSTTTIYEAYMQFNLVGGTLSDARMIGELSYQLGSELDGIINEIGVQTLLDAIGLSSDTASDNSVLKEFLEDSGYDSSTLADVNEVKSAIDSGLYLADYVIYLARTALMEVGNAPFESLAIYYADEKENIDYYLYAYQLLLARAVKKGMDKAFTLSKDIKTKEDLIASFATFKLNCEEIASNSPLDRVTRLEELKASFSEYLETVDALSTSFMDIEDAEDIKNLSNERLTVLQNYSNYLNEYNYAELSGGTDELLSSMAVNIVFNLLSDALSGALES